MRRDFTQNSVSAEGVVERLLLRAALYDCKAGYSMQCEPVRFSKVLFDTVWTCL